MADQYLVLMDTNKIKDYVYATGRLKEIRGASALFDHLNKDRIIEIVENHGGKLIFAAGGAAMMLFEAETAAQLTMEEIEALYLRETHFASISGVVIPYPEDASFSDIAKAAAYQLRRKKMQGHGPSQALPQPLFYRCDRCGSFGAEYFQQYPGSTYLCRVCQKKQDVAQKGEDGAFQIDAQSRLKARGQERFENWESVVFPNTIEGLKRVSRPESYMATVYADGNGVGSIIQNEISSVEEMQVLSGILDKAIYDSILDALLKVKAIRKGFIPMIPILIGGDDLIVLISPQFGLDFANDLCISFKKTVRDLSIEAINETPNLFGGQPLDVSMSAGVVISKTNHPIEALEALSGDLLLSAKRLTQICKGDYGNQGVLDFQVIKAPTTNPLEIIKNQQYQLGREIFGTARPFLCERVKGLKRPAWPDLKKAILLLKESDFPKNKLHQWQSLLSMPAGQARLEIKYFMSRLSEKHAQVLKEVSELLRLENVESLFIQDPLELPNRRSPYPDIEEIYEFI